MSTSCSWYCTNETRSSPPPPNLEEGWRTWWRRGCAQLKRICVDYIFYVEVLTHERSWSENVEWKEPVVNMQSICLRCIPKNTYIPSSLGMFANVCCVFVLVALWMMLMPSTTAHWIPTLYRSKACSFCRSCLVNGLIVNFNQHITGIKWLFVPTDSYQ